MNTGRAADARRRALRYESISRDLRRARRSVRFCPQGLDNDAFELPSWAVVAPAFFVPPCLQDKFGKSLTDHVRFRHVDREAVEFIAAISFAYIEIKTAVRNEIGGS